MGGFDMGSFGGLGDLGNMFGGFGGGGGASTVMFSSSFSSSSGGKTTKTETRYENGKRVTKTIESDASGTRAMMEEEQNGRSRAERHGTVVLIRRTSGSKPAEQLEGRQESCAPSWSCMKRGSAFRAGAILLSLGLIGLISQRDALHGFHENENDQVVDAASPYGRLGGVEAMQNFFHELCDLTTRLGLNRSGLRHASLELRARLFAALGDVLSAEPKPLKVPRRPELEYLELRMLELQGIADLMVVAESGFTFRGDAKPRLFQRNRQRFQAFENTTLYLDMERCSNYLKAINETRAQHGQKQVFWAIETRQRPGGRRQDTRGLCAAKVFDGCESCES
eukprot:g31594.t1